MTLAVGKYDFTSHGSKLSPELSRDLVHEQYHMKERNRRKI